MPVLSRLILLLTMPYLADAGNAPHQLYHLFYQSNPTMTGVSTGFDMHWGHSVSKDLVHWEEWPIALHPDAAGNIFSGTAFVLEERIPGLNDQGPLPTPTLFFTGTTPHTQHIATSADGGRTWPRYAGNPVVANMGAGDRDPKVVWHEESGHYIMILFVGNPRTYRILRSTDLQAWEQVSVLPGWNECPEFLPVKSPATGEDLWLLYGAFNNEEHTSEEPIKFSSAYQLGRLDGESFTPVTEVRRAHQGPNFYAALTFANEPEGRYLMMGWVAGAKFPDEPFNGCATLPLRMQLKAMNGKDVLCYEPAREVAALRGAATVELEDVTGAEAMEQLRSLDKGAALDIEVRVKKEQSGPVNVTIRGQSFVFEPATSRLYLGRPGDLGDGLPLHPEGSVDARFLIDRGLIESFWNGGEGAFSVASLHTDPGPVFAVNDEVAIEKLVVYPMATIWEPCRE